MIGRRTFLGAVAGLAAAPVFAASDRPQAKTSLGQVRGFTEGGLSVFRGIRYGSAERFQSPVAPTPSRDVIDARSYGPSCPQTGLGDLSKSEDCLYLNIWTPEANARARRPVMVYFHGGAYSSGTANSPLLDGRHLAAHGDVVVVTVGHRLNAFGYLYLARLDPRFPDSGNAGQLDLILALRWIRDNIAAFGGDPGKVMVFGQSGGGAKIATLMGTPAAAGLFHRAATMSGQQVTASGPLNATRRARAYMARLRVESVDALLALPAERLVEGLEATDPILGGGVYFGPVLDMKWLTRHPFWPDANPQSNAIPMMLGNTRDETRGFYGPDHPKIVGLDWTNLAERMAPELRIDAHPEWVVAEYRRMFPEHRPEQVFFAATTAGRSWRGQVIEAEERARAGVPGYVYQLDFASPVEPWRGAAHMLDIPLVFGTLDAPGAITGTGAGSRAVSAAVMGAFLAFARTGDPGWRPYTLPERATRIFDASPRTENDPRRWQRELFARFPYIQPGT
ncbi:carboxylesterase/lipase family protein [Sphingosinicella sp. LHD-64]|uniref:carboxylesterase/lipase family protein n=1 Tax=Sphingosinicella sp. LHD-64 TaxID=3072139 RepID=UPI00280F9698|nr:carboxylesterase/lipase family protein [Sphingosinicella sp. LHD-64]MDQ8756977.1 carboxylesterase/lipase family protein [Sphingosinicella sp. LHD-64]